MTSNDFSSPAILFEKTFLVAEGEEIATALTRNMTRTYFGAEVWFLAGQSHVVRATTRQAKPNGGADDGSAHDLEFVASDFSKAEETRVTIRLRPGVGVRLANLQGLGRFLFSEAIVVEPEPFRVRRYFTLPGKPRFATFVFAGRASFDLFVPPPWAVEELTARDWLAQQRLLSPSAATTKAVTTRTHAVAFVAEAGAEPVEYERRFLVDSAMPEGQAVTRIQQAYFSTDPSAALRMRCRDGDDHAVIAVKGKRLGGRRAEEEAYVPAAFGRGFIDATHLVVEKDRHHLVLDETTWDVDVFLGKLHGLVIAECEFTSLDSMAKADAPSFATREVTSDERYNNERLVVDGIPDFE